MKEQPIMTASELALLMLKWEEKQKEIAVIEAQIKGAVLTIGKTQTVGNVRATYSAGRKTYDYANAWERYGHEAEQKIGIKIEDYAKVSYDYRQACIDGGIKDIFFTQSEPSVSVKLLE